MSGIANDFGRRVCIAAGNVELQGNLDLPVGATGVVLLPHGSGVARRPGDNVVARTLRQAGLGTLWVELLTAEEQQLDARKACFRFDISLLAGRLAGAADWLSQEGATGLGVGCFAGGNTSAAAFALAAKHPRALAAVVAHEGRPDLADQVLSHVAVPTLLLVDGSDEPLIGINRDGLKQLAAQDKEMVILEGKAALVEDDDDEESGRLAARWFRAHLGAAHGPAK